jgi:hypothetical protein
VLPRPFKFRIYLNLTVTDGYALVLRSTFARGSAHCFHRYSRVYARKGFDLIDIRVT